MRLNLEQLKKQAKERRASGLFPTLAAAQRAVANEHGHPSWTKLKLAVQLDTLKNLIEDGNADAVRALVAESPRLVAAVFPDGRTPLHVAAGENRPDVVAVLMQAGALPQAKLGTSAHSALSWALTCWAFDAAYKLVELGVAPDLFCAAGLGLVDRISGFWTDGVLRHHPSQTGSSRTTETGDPLPRPPKRDIDQVSDALYIACRCGRIDAARLLLDRGADPNWRGFAGATCLAWAEFAAVPELTMLLRERGGRDDILDYEFQSTPKAFGVMVLAGWGFTRRLVARLEADRSLVTTSGGKGTLLHAAAAGGHAGTVKILLHFGADKAAKDPSGRTPAELAAANGHTSVVALVNDTGPAA